VKGKTQKASYFLTFAYGTAFAVSDELHQGFVGYFDSGVFGGVRNPDFFDVSADVAGIAVAMLILHTISKCQKTNKLYTGTK
jgi:hypothetical protein